MDKLPFSDHRSSPSWIEIDGDVYAPDTGKDFVVEPWAADHVIGQSNDEIALNDDVPELETLDRSARLTMLFEAEGFYPTSNEEFNRMIAMSSANGSKYRAARHLNEVLRHQQSHEVPDPGAALHSILADFYQYAEGARLDHLSIQGLRTDPHVTEANPRQGFMNVTHMKDLVKDPQVARALVIVTRSREIASFAKEGRLDPLLKINQLETSAEKAKRVMQSIMTVRAGEMIKLLDTASRQETNRLRYWLERLEESRQHSVVSQQTILAISAIRRKLSSSN